MDKIRYHRHNIVLYNVLNQEVVFEEYFCNLMQFKDFRDLFLQFINKDNLFDSSKIHYHNFNTEVRLNKQFDKKDYGRADLFLKIKNDEFIFEIKNKCNTTLTENQPISYLEYLNNQNQNLFFIIPRHYNHQNEIYKRWQEYNNFNDIKNKIFYWEDFIHEITKSKIYETSVEIKIFYDFCLYWFNMEIIKFSEEEKAILQKGYIVNDLKNKSIPSMIQKLEEIVDNIGESCNMKIDNETIGYTYSIIVNNYIIYFGINYDLWEEIGIPISIEIQSIKSDYQEFKLNLNDIILKNKLYEETSKTYRQFSLYVDLRYSMQDDNFQEITKKLILNILDQLKLK